MKTTTFTANKRGFTLVEILMVLLILAVLSGGVVFLSSDNSSSIMANKIISEIRTMKAASIMYRRDNGMIATGTPVSKLAPYMGSTIENSEVNYSFVFDENGRVFLQADLSELDDRIRQKIADLADQNLYLRPGEESASLPADNSFLALFNPKNVFGYFTATPAYAGNDHSHNNSGIVRANSWGWFDDFLEDFFGDDDDDDVDEDSDLDDDIDLDEDDDDGDYEDELDEDNDDNSNNDTGDSGNDSGEGEYETPDFSGGSSGEDSDENSSQEDSGSSAGSVSAKGKYSGGDKLLIRI